MREGHGSLRGTNANFARTLQLGKDPVTGLDRGSVAFAGVQRSLGSATNSYEIVSEVDFTLRPEDKLQFRYIHAPQNTPYDTQNFPNQLPGFDTTQYGTVDNAGITETHIFTPALLNELRLSWSRIGFTFDLRPETYANPLALAPAITIANVTGYGVPAGTVPQGRFQNTYVLQDAVSWNHGKHFFKVGFDVSDIRIRDQVPFNYYGSIAYSTAAGAGYSSLANYLDDFGGTASNSASIQFGNPIARPEIWSQNYYAEDTWKMRPNLSMDFGVRYEYNGTPFNYLGYPGFNSADPACFPCNVKQQADTNNIAPRLGFNYSPVAGGKTVISGGFGLFYDHVFSNIIDNIQGSSPNAAAKNIVSATSGRGTAAWSGVLNRITNKNPLASDTSNVIASNLIDPENYQWNLRVQQQLPQAFVLSAAYVGNRGAHQYATTEFNPLVPGSTRRVVSTRGRIIREDNTNDSMYHAGQVQIEHRATHGLTLRGAYTFSKMMDTGSEIFTSSNWSTYSERQYPNPRRYEWGPSAFDLRHVFSLTYVYAPPIWRPDGGAKFVAAIVNHWTLSGIGSLYSGTPVNRQIGYDFNADGITNDRPQIANPSAPLNTWAIHGDDFFNVPAGNLLRRLSGVLHRRRLPRSHSRQGSLGHRTVRDAGQQYQPQLDLCSAQSGVGHGRAARLQDRRNSHRIVPRGVVQCLQSRAHEPARLHGECIAGDRSLLQSSLRNEPVPRLWTDQLRRPHAALPAAVQLLTSRAVTKGCSTGAPLFLCMQSMPSRLS